MKVINVVFTTHCPQCSKIAMDDDPGRPETQFWPRRYGCSFCGMSITSNSDTQHCLNIQTDDPGLEEALTRLLYSISLAQCTGYAKSHTGKEFFLFEEGSVTFTLSERV